MHSGDSGDGDKHMIVMVMESNLHHDDLSQYRDISERKCNQRSFTRNTIVFKIISTNKILQHMCI